MRGMRARLSGERGLVGKAFFVMLVFVVILGVAAADTGSILYTRYKMSNLAQEASFDAAAIYKSTRSTKQALQTAVNDVQETDPSAKLKAFSVGANGEVTVTVAKKASTFAAKYIGFLKKYQHVEATYTSPAPP